MANRMIPLAEGQEKDVLLVLDKRQRKVSAVKGFDKEGNLQTIPSTAAHGGEFMQVDKNNDVSSNFLSSFYRKHQDTSGLELFSVRAPEAERNAKVTEDNRRNPIPEGSKRTEMLRVPKPDFHKFKQGYRFDPAKIDWENLGKVGITADILKNTKDFGRMIHGYRSCNTYTISGTVGGSYLEPTDVKLFFYQTKDGAVASKLHGVRQDEKLLQRPFYEHDFTRQEQGNLQGTGNLGGIVKIKNPKSGEQTPVFVSRDRYTHELEYMRADRWKCPDTICNVEISLEQKAVFEAGQAVKMGNLQFRDGMKRSAYLQVNAVERGLEFLPRAVAQFLQQGQQQVTGLKDGQGVRSNGHMQSGVQSKSSDKVQPKDATPATEGRTQVTVNTEGKTNEATKQGKEPLKQGQQKPTTEQRGKQGKVQDKGLKADKPKKPKGMKMQYPPLKSKEL